MFIMQIEPLEGTKFHPFHSQSHRERCWLEGYITVPEELIPQVRGCGGYCDLVIQHGVLVQVIPGIQPAPEPSAQEDLDAMIVDHELRLTLLELGVM